MPIYEIYSTEEIDLKQLSDLKPEQIKFFFDMDQTLIDVVERRIMSFTNKQEYLKFLEAVNAEDKKHENEPEYESRNEIIFSDKANSYALVEPAMKVFIENLRKYGYETFGLTARRTGLPTQTATENAEDNLLRKLAELNVSFSSRLNNIPTDMIPLDKLYSELQDKSLNAFKKPSKPFCKQGMVFATNFDKGEALLELFAQTGCKDAIKMVVVLDNERSNLEKIAGKLEPAGIQVIGYHYKGYELVDKQHPLDLQVVAKQLQLVIEKGVFPSDAETKVLLQQESVAEEKADFQSKPRFT